LSNESVPGEGETYPDTANLPSGDMSVLRTQDECPESVATAPDPGFPEDEVRTSWRIRRLSSDAERRSWISLKPKIVVNRAGRNQDDSNQ